MTDNEIIKALECCVECDMYCYECSEDCPLKDTNDCTYVLRRNSLDFINRQKAENERLRKKYSFLHKRYIDMMQMNIDVSVEELIQAQSEAIKEFAKKSEKRLIKLYEKYYRMANKPKKETDMFYQGRAEAIWECIITNRNLVKEMEGGTK